MASPVITAGAVRTEISTDRLPLNDPLYAKILVIRQDAESIAVISLDTVCLGGGIGDLSDSFFPELKRRLRALGIGHVLCGTTHTHTNMPMLCAEEIVLDRVCAAAEQALGKLEPVAIGSGTGREASFQLNRTLPQQDGKSWSVRLAHPCPPTEQITALAETDDRIGILRLDRLDGTPLCVVFTFGCHPLLGYANNQPTANFPGVAERLIEEQTGAIAMLLQSCGGDVIENTYKNYDIPKNCENPGISLGLAVLKALRDIQTKPVDMALAQSSGRFPLRKDFDQVRQRLHQEQSALCASLHSCPLNFKTFLPLYAKYTVDPEYPLDYAYNYLQEQARGCSQLRDQDQLNRKHIDRYLHNLQTMETLSRLAADLATLAWHEAHNQSLGADTVAGELLGLRLGDCVLITAPVEPLVAVGARMRQYAPLEKTFLVGYANGYMHYGAPPEAYSAGGYETIECMLAPEWLAIYEALAKDILSRLQAPL